MSAEFTALVMAGSRGSDDPVAAAAGSTHKCLVEVGGVPMLTRVLDTLDASDPVGQIVLAIEAGTPLEQLPGYSDRTASGTVRRLDAAGSPARSLLQALDQFPGAFPWLVVTGDHPLLTADMITHFCSEAGRGGDIAVGLASAAQVLGRYPESVRTLLKFQEGDFCGCNLYTLNTPAARRAAEFWIRVERARKRPWRLIRELGAKALLLYWRRRLSLVEAMERVSCRLDLQVTSILMPYPESAIDVDKPADLVLAESILNERAGAA